MGKRRKHYRWEDPPQETILYRRQLIGIVHELMARPNSNGLAFLLFAFEQGTYDDILDYISLLPEEAVNEILERFAEGIPGSGL